MSDPIEFYYDLSSPYGYIGAHLIEDVAARHEREVLWKPFMLGAVFKEEGTQPLVFYPKKGAYARHDMARTARLHGLPLNFPEKFPQLTVNAARIILWAGHQDQAERKRLSLAFYHGIFGEGHDISDKAVIRNICETHGIDWAEAEAAMADPAIKDQLKEETQAALDRGVFGAPYFIVGDEPFWGVDHLPQLEKWLESGGW
ncbi:2-hydroxychromene-2-carboxylate isomerase [Aestuariispira insulae]|uniref:2-hydroxychromene-2-carboxylate isomerase n=1 Tax=Aestuariispira insulae TaxID=1461337 RepID=A0A3D9HT00_9PROT|nr:2-hydroxychromene-2-carboxylate isomerase [Aestuariispira insulae]RED52545.1 2-hydroxychromene-2-carboxylate isomerase [Aestuariispira insulae]